MVYKKKKRHELPLNPLKMVFHLYKSQIYLILSSDFMFF